MNFPQTNNLIAKLEKIRDNKITIWKRSENLPRGIEMEGEPWSPHFDDKDWKNFRLEDWSTFESIWVRYSFVMPENIMGIEPSGELLLKISVDDHFYAWIDGEAKGYFSWDSVISLGKYEQGKSITIALKIFNKTGMLRILSSELVCQNTKKLGELIDDFSMNLKTAVKLLGFDTYQTNSRVRTDPGTDLSRMDTNLKLELAAKLEKKSKSFYLNFHTNEVHKTETAIKDFLESLPEIKSFIKQFSLYFVANAHIDAAWLWREIETIAVAKNTFESVFRIMDEHPDFVFSQSSAQYYEWMEKLYPGIFCRINEKISEGRWETIGGMWIEPDCNLISGESWYRQLLYGQKYFIEKTGKPVKIGWNPDSFGYNLNMPSLFKNAGIDGFITQKIGWNDTTVFPHRMFWWTSPDNSRVLVYFPFDYVNTMLQGFQLIDWLRQYEANTGEQDMMVLFGVGDHGGGPTIDMLQRIEKLKSLDFYPAIEFGTVEKYMNRQLEKGLTHLPVWKTELYLEYHRAVLTTQSRMKFYNRVIESKLLALEKLISILEINGYKTTNPDLKEFWKRFLFHQFHDILPGTSLREVHIDASESLAELLSNIETEISMLMNQFYDTATIKTENKKILYLFNPLFFDRNDVVNIRFSNPDGTRFSLTDTEGESIDSSFNQISKYESEISFRANLLKAGAVSKFYLFEGNNEIESDLSVSQTHLENAFYRIEIDSVSGDIISLRDKRDGREYFCGAANQIQLLEDKPSDWDAWNLGLTGRQYPIRLDRIEVSHHDKFRISIDIFSDFLNPEIKKAYPTPDFPNSFFKRRITLYKNYERIDFELYADWWETNTMLKIAFPLNFSSADTKFDAPYGSINRSNRKETDAEKAVSEVCGLKWVHCSDGEYNFTLLSDLKYGYDLKENTLRISMLRSPKWPDPTADRGKHMIRYALLTGNPEHSGNNLPRLGYEFNNPPLYFSKLQDSKLKKLSEPAIGVSATNVIITILKKCENGKGYFIQMYETEGKTIEFELLSKRKIRAAFISDFSENKKCEVKNDSNSISISINAYSVLSLVVNFE
ncbi:MAG: hypothetical protein K9I71_09895 [Ignavibacteriales bacterium]|nr:hypothetical protein [Ignavibacteriales bacterium]MCF8316428.1 hypothetical protein [Ignavibacteriales bacterium]MCF8437908.1 hypothetical protein [Ignavibacteriales bacterium]